MGESADKLVASVGFAASENADSGADTNIRAIVESGCRTARIGVDWRADGVAVLGPGAAAGRLVGPWLQALYWELRRRNTGRPAPMRLTVGLDVAADSGGVAGDLGATEAAQWLLAAVPRASLLIGLSDRVYGAVLDAGAPRFELENVTGLEIGTPDTPTWTWYQVMGHPTPTVPAALTTRDEQPERAAPIEPDRSDGSTGHRVSAGRDSYVIERNSFGGGSTRIGSQGGGA